MSMTIQPQQVLDFWFVDHSAADWFSKNPAFDQAISERFLDTYWQAAAGELSAWRQTAEGRLAEIIVLDQFARNLFRDQAQQFAADAMALMLAQEAIAQGFDQQLAAQQRLFMYMPYMHSESVLIHQQAVVLFTALGLSDNLDFEYKHQAIIDRFDRYPHRNALLGRASTAEELAFLQQPSSSF